MFVIDTIFLISYFKSAKDLKPDNQTYLNSEEDKMK